MSTQSEDELFEQAASEVQEDIETALEEAQSELPPSDAIWSVDDASNILGVLNAVQKEAESADIEESLVEARKWMVLCHEAEALDDDELDQLSETIEELEQVAEHLEIVEEHVAELIPVLPELNTSLQELSEGLDLPDENEVEEENSDSDESSDGGGQEKEDEASEADTETENGSESGDGEEAEDDSEQDKVQSWEG